MTTFTHHLSRVLGEMGKLIPYVAFYGASIALLTLPFWITL